MADRVVHLEMAGTDGEALAGFYRELFGWTGQVVEGSGGTYRLLDTATGGPTAGIGSWPGVPPYLTFYVEVADLDGAVERARELGGAVVMEPKEFSPGRRTALIRDPDGNMVGLMAAAAG